MKVTCPLGSECVKTDGSGNVLEQCAWRTALAGKDPQTGETINEYKCAMAWMPLMMVENAMTNRGQTAALESFRNEMTKGQQEFNKIAAASVQLKLVGRNEPDTP